MAPWQPCRWFHRNEPLRKNSAIQRIACRVCRRCPGARIPAQQQNHAAVVNTIELPTAFVASVSTALEMRYRDVAGVQISPDVRGSRLVILAPEALQPQIQREAMQVYASESRGGGKSTDGAAGVRAAGGSLQVRLASISWREFEDSLQRVVGKRIPVTTSQNGERASFQLTGAPLEGTRIDVDRRENVVTVVAPNRPCRAGKR